MSRSNKDIIASLCAQTYPWHSQLGQDAVLLEWFKANRQRLIDEGVSPFVVDIGAYDGVTFSNVLPFIVAGFHALLVEGSPRSFVKLLDNYPEGKYPETNCAQLVIRESTPRVTVWHDAPLVATAQQAAYDKWKTAEKFTDHFIGTVSPLAFWSWFKGEWQVDPMILSIDLEGETANAVRGMISIGIRPQIAVIEMEHSGTEHDDEKTIVESMRKLGMRLAYRLQWDAFFVRDEDTWTGPSAEVVAICDKWYAEASAREQARHGPQGALKA